MTLRVLSTMALQGALEALALPIEAEFHPTVRLLERIRAGERADLAILTAEGLDALLAEGVLAPPRTDLAWSSIGVAVRAGAPHPDVSTEAAFVAALLAAPSLALSQAGASGLFMAGLLERLGIADRVLPKATILKAGYTASLLADGTVALAIQQVSELMMVPGIEIAGTLPESLGGRSLFSAAPFAPASADASILAARLASRETAPTLRQHGLEPIGPT